MKLSESLLTKALALLWRDASFADRYLPHIPEGTFEKYEALIRIYIGLTEWRKKYGTHPEDLPTFAEYLLGELPDLSPIKPGEDSENFLDALVQIHGACDDTSRGFVEERLQGEIVRAQSERLMLDALQVSKAEKFSPEELRKLIDDLQKVERVQIEGDLGSSIVSELEARQKRRLREIKRVARVPTGIDKVDRTMRGGVPGKKLCMVMGRIGKGKTTSLVHFGKTAFLHGYPVLFLSLELSQQDIEDAFDAALTRTPRLELYERYERVQRRFSKWKQHFDEDIRIIEASAYRFSVAMLEAKLEEMKANKFFPKVIIVDYADLMLPEKHYKDKRFELETIYVTLRRLAKENDLVVWTASQSNRQGGRGIMGTEHASESDAKGAASDLVLTINQTQEEKGENVVNLFVAKSRLGRDQFLIEGMTQDLETANFFSESEIMGTQLVPARTFAKKKKGGRR